jgi:uroporphyrinogen-III decarboxylase
VWKYSDITADLTLVQQPEPSYLEEDFPLDTEPESPDPSVYEVVDAIIAEFGASRFILGPNGGEAGMVLLGDMAYGLMLYALQPALMHHVIAYATRMANLLDRDAIRPGTDGVLWGTDFSATTGPFMSPCMFREFCLSSIKERVQAMKSHGLAVFKHACGNNWKLLDMFVEAGYDGYQSIQTTASMELTKVKAQVGNALVLWGGVQVENLVSGTPEMVRDNVRDAMRAGAPGGGYIFGTTHSVAVGTRYDNFMTMLDAYHTWAAKAATW